MDDYESLSHSKWECKYHVVFIPKCRRKTLYGELEATSLGVSQVAGGKHRGGVSKSSYPKALTLPGKWTIEVHQDEVRWRR